MEGILFCNVCNSLDGVNMGKVDIEKWYVSIDITHLIVCVLCLLNFKNRAKPYQFRLTEGKGSLNP